jgi:cytochrome c-type biogenesis protein CcmH/NrfG
MPVDACEIERIAASDLNLACEKARELVADHLDDEASAVLLRDIVQQLAAEQRPALEDSELVGALPDVRTAARLFETGEDEQAEILLRKHLSTHRNDPPAMRLMAQIAAKCGFFANAERIARRALQIDPNSIDIRLTLARILFFHGSEQEGVNAVEQALELVGEAIRLDGKHKAALNLKANFLSHLRRPTEAIAAFGEAVRANPLDTDAWIAAGTVRRNLGHVGHAVAAFRTALAIDPLASRGWLELTNLKTVKLFPSDTPLIESALDLDRELDDSQRAELHFSLFKAYDDSGDHQAAARHLAEGNALKRQLHPYDAEIVTKDVDRSIATYTDNFFSDRKLVGSETDEIIFIIGMYRAGSTLVEQILSSHSKVEGTEELPYVLQAATEIGAAKPGETIEGFMATANSDQLDGMARTLLQLCRKHKKTNRPYFIDKNPANWRYLGMIHALLPKARFIDVRRNPLDCGFANYAQHYNAGAAFSYDQRDIAHYYADYVRLMRHFAPLLPNQYHRVIYEDLVDQPEREIRRLIDFLGLEFEESCLRFFETDRPIYTPSAQQVRRPINRSGLDKWRPYAPWLQQLVAELGDLPSSYRN